MHCFSSKQDKFKAIYDCYSFVDIIGVGSVIDCCKSILAARGVFLTGQTEGFIEKDL
jgi:hypothetical protein